MTVGELLARMSSSEITEWIAIYLIENEEAKERELERRNQAANRQTLSRPRTRR